MRNFDPVSTGAARPSVRRMARWMLRALMLTAITCFACGFTAQKTATPSATPRQETAGMTAQATPANPETALGARCYGGRVSRWGNEDCPPEAIPPYWDKRAEKRDNGRSPRAMSGANILLLILGIAAIGGLIYWLKPAPPAAAEFCIPQAEKDKLLAEINNAFTMARGEATAANIPGALPLLKLAENAVKGAVNKMKTCDPCAKK